jgi:spermidine/putrescine transport system permease protein
LDDFVITFFTAGVGSTTLPLRIYSMVKLGITPEINAISSLLLVASMVLVILSLLAQRKGGGSVADMV